MKITVTKNFFISRFEDMGRKEGFSTAGLEALFDYLEDLEKDSGIEMELDVIALCCDYTESTINEALSNYSLDDIDDLKSQTTAIRVYDNTIIYQNF